MKRERESNRTKRGRGEGGRGVRQGRQDHNNDGTIYRLMKQCRCIVIHHCFKRLLT